MAVGAQTPIAIPDEGWIAIRRAGKLLFEYHPEQSLVRVVRRQRPFVVDLRQYSPPLAKKRTVVLK